jgi:mannosyltransferase OCH1-like enzyme
MIPKTVHYCWLSGDPYPELIGKYIQSWKKFLPDYQFVLWDKPKVENIQNEWLKQTIALKKYAFASDYVRIYSLFNYGGVYLDADVELVASLDPFLKHNFFIGVEYNNDLEPAVFGAVPGHLWLNHLLNYYNNRSFIKSDGAFDEKTLPNIFNETAAVRYGFKSNGNIQVIDNESIAIYPSDYFSPKNIYSQQIIRTRNTVAIHHFESSWFEKNSKHNLKQSIHRILIKLGGKSFHNRFVQFIRKING